MRKILNAWLVFGIRMSIRLNKEKNVLTGSATELIDQEANDQTTDQADYSSNGDGRSGLTERNSSYENDGLET